MMKNLQHFIFVFALWYATSALAVTAIFYQPQTRDFEVNTQNWPVIFSAVKQAGFDTLVFQWTGYGNAFSSNEEKVWLKNRILEARQAKLNVIIGLSSEPDIFTRIKQTGAALSNYLRKLRESDVNLVKYWLQNLPVTEINGWYIALEIDDYEWREPERRAQLQKHLADEALKIHAIDDRPIYISSYFRGWMGPERYARLLKNINTDQQLKIWVQDGAGSSKLSPAETALYFSFITNCENPITSGVIFEIFKQTSKDNQTFKAEPVDPKSMSLKIKQRAACGGDSVFFSLRYWINLNQPN